jgi:hypothetical protein
MCYRLDSGVMVEVRSAMPRKLRVEYPGALYPVMSRGNRREDNYLDNVDRQDFLETLAGAYQKSDWQVGTYCLMSNHYQLAPGDEEGLKGLGVGGVWGGRPSAEGNWRGWGVGWWNIIVVWLRRGMSLTVKAIMAGIHRGTPYTANNRLHQAMKTHPGTFNLSNE